MTGADRRRRRAARADVVASVAALLVGLVAACGSAPPDDGAAAVVRTAASAPPSSEGPVVLPGPVGSDAQDGGAADGAGATVEPPGAGTETAASVGTGAPVAPPASTVDCPAPSTTVRSAEGLQAALDGAQPGDAIHIADGVYTGAFVLARSGSERAPLFLCGGPGAVLDGGGIKKGYVLHLDGAQHVRLVGFTVRNGQKGVMADATSHSVIQGLTVTDIGDEGIHLRSASTGNAVLENTIRRTGLRRDRFGEGIYVGSATSNWPTYSNGEPDRSDDNLVQGNRISETTAEPIDVKEGTTGGRLIGNVLDGSALTGADSLIDVKGNGWLIEGNVGQRAPEGFQTHHVVTGWGSGNLFRANVVDVDGTGYHFKIHDPATTMNRVACDNRTGAGAPVRSNVECNP